MKLVVGYINPGRFEPIREALLSQGVPSVSATNSSGTTPEATVVTTYRNARSEQHARAKARVECVVGDEHAQTVVETLLSEGDDHTFVYVVDVENAFPLDTIKLDAPEVPA